MHWQIWCFAHPQPRLTSEGLLLNRSAVQVQTWPINLEIVGILNCHKSDTTKPLVGQLFNGANGEL